MEMENLADHENSRVKKRPKWFYKMNFTDFQEESGVMSVRETASLRFGVQIMEYSNVRKRREVFSWDPPRIWSKNWSSSEEWREGPQCSRGRWQVILSLWDLPHTVGEQLKPAETQWLQATPEDSREKHSSGMEQWIQHPTVAGELFKLRHPPGKGDWLATIVERGQGNSEIRAAVGWLHLAAPSIRVKHNHERYSRSDIQAEFKPAWSPKVLQVEQLRSQLHIRNQKQPAFQRNWGSVELGLSISST